MGEGGLHFRCLWKVSSLSALTEQVDAPAIELYTTQLMPVALSRGEYRMATPVSEGENYVLHIAGDYRGGALPASLAIKPQTPVTDAADWLLDVNSDGWVSPLDALLVIHGLNDSHRDTVVVNGSATYLLDVNGDGVPVTAHALLIIIYLNQSARAEGEYSSPDPAVPIATCGIRVQTDSFPIRNRPLPR